MEEKSTAMLISNGMDKIVMKIDGSDCKDAHAHGGWSLFYLKKKQVGGGGIYTA